jgi:XRE family transcriptional regulator, fatty acid utilization regulator
MSIERKLFLGGRLKRLRRDLGLTQTAMAADLGVSPSYLNHLERNQRPVTAQVLLRLAETYDLDLRAFTGDADASANADLQEALADPLFRDLAIPRHEVTDLAENAPATAEAVVRLYRAYLDARRRQGLGRTDDGAPEGGVNATDWVRDYTQAHHNHFADLDALGERLFEGLAAPSHALEAAATEWLQSKLGIQVRVVPSEVMGAWSRRYDPHRRRLMLSETLGSPSRLFSVLYQLALNEGAEALNGLVEIAAPPDTPTRRLLKVGLANYLAAAILMPYGHFHEAAEATGYDIDLLRARFGASFEQVAHRLTTLGRPGARGVPFFMVRADAAGNISKRFASGAFPFSRFGGACPRWNLHAAFQTPGRILTQVIRSVDGGDRFFTIARTVRRPTAAYSEAGDSDLALGLGCELKHASRLVYARGVDLEAHPAVEVGPVCRLCERPACRERAAAPITRTLTVEEWTKSVSPFPFSAHG